MFEFVSKALLALVLDKRARDALETTKHAPPAVSPQGQPAPAAKPKSATPPAMTPAMTDARRELIRNALAVQRSKQHVFDNLDEDAKAKLLIAAVKALGIPPDQVERELRRPRRNSGPDPKR